MSSVLQIGLVQDENSRIAACALEKGNIYASLHILHTQQGKGCCSWFLIFARRGRHILTTHLASPIHLSHWEIWKKAAASWPVHRACNAHTGTRPHKDKSIQGSKYSPQLLPRLFIGIESTKESLSLPKKKLCIWRLPKTALKDFGNCLRCNLRSRKIESYIIFKHAIRIQILPQ